MIFVPREQKLIMHIIHPRPVHMKEIYSGRSSLSLHISSPGSYLRPTFY